jgi:uncharacterized alkaline shock family protein YloU
MKNEPTPARADGTIAHRSAVPAAERPSPRVEVELPSPVQHESGQSLVSRRAISQIVRAAVSGSYGVTGLSDDRPAQRLMALLGLRPPAILVRLRDGINVELRILVAAGVPVAEVARQVDSAVRYSVRRAIGREIDSRTIHVGGLRFQGAIADRDASAAPGSDAT